MKLFFFRAVHYVLRHLNQIDKYAEKKITELSAKQFNEVLKEKAFDADNPFFNTINLITHAGGGMGGMAYLNCEEAFGQYRQKGNCVFEYDVDETPEHEYILTHDGDGKSKIDFRFTPMKIEDCLKLLSANKEIVVIFDCKFHKLDGFVDYIKRCCPDKSVLDRIVIQIFEEKNVKEVRDVYDFRMLYVCMTNTNYAEAANLCLGNGIHAVSVPAKAFENRSDWSIFLNNRIHMFAYTVNTLTEYRELTSMGVTGVFSDFLTEEDIKRV